VIYQRASSRVIGFTHTHVVPKSIPINIHPVSMSSFSTCSSRWVIDDSGIYVEDAGLVVCLVTPNPFDADCFVVSSFKFSVEFGLFRTLSFLKRPIVLVFPICNLSLL
jgi:hypothetical protein